MDISSFFPAVNLPAPPGATFSGSCLFPTEDLLAPLERDIFRILPSSVQTETTELLRYRTDRPSATLGMATAGCGAGGSV